MQSTYSFFSFCQVTNYYLRSQAQSASARFLSTTPMDYQFISSTGTQPYSSDMTATRKLETQCRYSAEHLATIQQDVVSMEVKMGITNRWQPSSPEYQAMMKYMSNYQYQRALDNLQRLVVQQLFELQQLNISQTGMCPSDDSLVCSS